MEKEISLYIHIPFCESKCVYCAFNSFCANEKVIDDYIELLTKEISDKAKRLAAGYVVKSIYFGGGTPSLLSVPQFEKIVNSIYDNFDIYEDAEFTIEANPNSLTEDKLKCWKKLRVNRLSVGVQALDNKVLAKLGRLHTSQLALEKIKLARKLFENISCDLIVGLEKQTGKDLCRYARELLTLKVKHISCYLLEVHEQTPLFKMVNDKKYVPISDDATITAFNKLANYLQDAGMIRYEISNFSFPSFEGKHNLNYWKRGEYLGFGLSAHSFLNGVRFHNADKLDDYADGKVDSEVLSAKEVDEEIIMLGLRCCLGFDIKDLKKIDLNKNPYFHDYLKAGILNIKDDIVKLNPIFYHQSNTIISNLFE